MRITEAARRLGISPRMLRYRESLGLLPAAGGRRAAGGHRQYDESDLRAVQHCLRLEQHYRISPAALAFGLRVLAEPAVAARLRAMGERLGRTMPPSAQALEFEQRRAQRWLDPSADRESYD